MSNGKLQPYRTTVMGLLKLPKAERQIYKDVITQVYPLRAQLSVLQSFCDNYLNFRDDDDLCPALFKAAAPWVLMQICDYGSMAMDFPGSGIFSQHELAFGFPVEWYDLKDGVYSFREYVMFYPFIYVDNPLSMGGGREIYGWGKSAVKVNYLEPKFDPHKPRVLASISRLEYPGAADFHAMDSFQRRLFARPLIQEAFSKSATTGRNLSDKPQTGRSSLQPEPDILHIQTGPDIAARSVEFLKVTQSPPLLAGRTGVVEAFDTIPRAIGSYLNSLAGMFETMVSFMPPSPGNAPGSKARARSLSLPDLISRWYGYLSRVTPAAIDAAFGSQSKVASSSSNQPAMPIVTLKQVRDADDNAHACYQAIVGSSIQIDRSKDGGLLFDPVSADISGGVEIQLLHADDDQDVVHQLGIDIDSSCLISDAPGHSLRPVTPFWVNSDLSYGPADLQYWRATQTYWSTTDHPRYTMVQGNEKEAGRTSRPQRPKRPPLRYSGLGSGAGEELRGPFKYSNLTARYLLFKPPSRHLKHLIDQYLQNEFYEFDLPSDGNARLWFVISDFDLQTQGRRGKIGTYEDRQLSIIAPMQWRFAKQPWRPVMVPICSFVGADWDFITELEVYGRVAIKATLTSPSNTWIETPDPVNTPTDLLEVATFLFPDKLRAKASDLPLFQIKAVQKIGGPASKTALDQLGLTPFLTRPYHVVSLKQIIDPKEMDCASYQALVSVERDFKMDPAPQKIDDLELLVTSYQCLPILEILGLSGRGTNPVVLHPSLAVCVSGSIADRGTAKNLCWRAGTGTWLPGSNPFLKAAAGR
jgi:hypothetical protein